MLYYAVNKAIMNDRVLYRVFKRGMEIIYFPLTGLKAPSVTTMRNNNNKKKKIKKRRHGVNHSNDLVSS